MKITTVRRISQLFFFALFLWFCIVTTVGEKFWQIRNWPINWILQLDPLVALGHDTFNRANFTGLCIARLGTVILTIIFGRFFCGWICPFGAIHQFVGYLGQSRQKSCRENPAKQISQGPVHKISGSGFLSWYGGVSFAGKHACKQDLLDPIPLVTRSFHLVLLPILDRGTYLTSVNARYYEFGWLILAVFATAVLLNLVIPRFYCRFICPTGRIFRNHQQVLDLAHRQDQKRMYQLQNVRKSLRGRLRAERQYQNRRMCALL